MSTPLLAAKLVELRQQFNYSQQEIADYLGVSRVAYSHYERNNRQLSLEMAVKLCKLYHIDISELINEKTVSLPVSSQINDNTAFVGKFVGGLACGTSGLSSVVNPIITNNINHLLKLLTGKNSTIDFTDISKEDMAVLAQYKKLNKQNQKEVRQFIKFKQQISKE